MTGAGIIKRLKRIVNCCKNNKCYDCPLRNEKDCLNTQLDYLTKLEINYKELEAEIRELKKGVTNNGNCKV